MDFSAGAGLLSSRIRLKIERLHNTASGRFKKSTF